jgi:hypothetical protein
MLTVVGMIVTLNGDISAGHMLFFTFSHVSCFYWLIMKMNWNETRTNQPSSQLFAKQVGCKPM